MARVVLANLVIIVTVSSTPSSSASPQVPSAPSSPTKQTELSVSPPNEAAILDVMALDKNGQPIADLRADEFYLRVNQQEQKIESVIYSDSEPIAVGFMFDISGSQREDRARELELKEAGNFLHRIWRPGDESFIAAFNDQLIVFSKPSHDLSDADKGLSTLANVVPRGSTALYDAICAIKVDRASGLQRRVLVLVFSDFGDNASHIPLHNAPQCARKAGFRIYSVPIAEEFVLSRRARKHALEAARELSEHTGGEFFLPQSKKDLSKIFTVVGGHLRSRYSISYSYSPAVSDVHSKSEKIELTTSRKGVKLLYAKEIDQQ